MERTAQEGEFRANIHLGATAKAIDVTREESELAIKAAKVIGLEIAGVDMVRSISGPKILEVNSSPGLEGIESATGIDIAAKMIEYLEGK
jgi:ribosomal protein S6--L-glutamate ligase